MEGKDKGDDAPHRRSARNHDAAGLGHGDPDDEKDQELVDQVNLFSEPLVRRGQVMLENHSHHQRNNHQQTDLEHDGPLVDGNRRRQPLQGQQKGQGVGDGEDRKSVGDDSGDQRVGCASASRVRHDHAATQRRRHDSHQKQSDDNARTHWNEAEEGRSKRSGDEDYGKS